MVRAIAIGISLFLLMLCGAASAQTVLTVSSGTTMTNSGSAYVLSTPYPGAAGSFINNGTFIDTTAPDTFFVNGDFNFSGTGTTTVYNFDVNQGLTTLNSSVVVNGQVIVGAGDSLNANGNLTLSAGSTMINNGYLSGVNTVIGLVTNATASSGACPLSTTLSLNVSGSNMIYQWQSSPDNSTWTNIASGGASATYSPTVTANTYYRCQLTTSSTNGGYSQATPSVLITMTSTIGVVISGGGSFCAGGAGVSITASGAGSSGATYTWAPASGLSSTISSSVTADPSATTVYTVTGTASNGCSNTAASIVTVNPLPLYTLSASGACPGAELFLNNTNTAYDSVIWKLGSSIVATHHGNNANANIYYTTATGTDISSAHGVASDTSGNMYMVDAAGLLVKYTPPFSSSSIGTALLTTSNSEINYPDNVFFANPYMYIVSFTSGHVLRYDIYNSHLDTIANSIGSGYSIAADSATGSFFIGNSGSLTQYAPYSGTPRTSGTTLASGNYRGIWVNPINHYLYAVNTVNHDVELYTPSGSSGPYTYSFSSVVAGVSGISGSDAAHLIDPNGIVMDRAGNIYVLDDGNSRVQEFPAGSTTGTNATTIATSSAASGAWQMAIDPTSGKIALATNTNYLAILGSNVTDTSHVDTLTASNTAGGNYTAIITSSSGCATTTTSVTIDPVPTVSIGGTTTICAGTGSTLTASGGSTYTWSPSTALSATTGASVTASPTVTTTYTVTGTNAGGCSNTNTVTITVNPAPTVSPITGTTTVTTFAPTTALSDVTSSGVWSSSNTAVGTVTSSGGVTGITEGFTVISYTVTSGGCSTSATATVTVSGYNAIALDGSNDFVQANNQFLADSNDFTMEMWVNPTASGGVLIGQDIPGNGHDQFSFSTTNNSVNFTFGNSSGSEVFNVEAPANSVPNGTWSHVAVERQGTNLYMFVNGVLQATTSTGTVIDNESGAPASGKPLRFGSRGNGSSGVFVYQGLMDEVKIWTRALCPDEIITDMAGELPAGQTGLQYYYKFDQGVAGGTNTGLTSVTDASGNGNTGTLYNSALSGTTSNWVSGHVTGTAGTYTPPTTITTGSSSASLCFGSTSSLSVSGGSNYIWSPSTGLSSATGASVTANPTAITVYSVTEAISGCSNTVTITVTPTNPGAVIAPGGGIITTVAGNSSSGYGSDGGAATSTDLKNPYGVTVDAAGNIYIADQGNNRVRKVSTSGIISTVAGNGTAGYVADGVAASTTELNAPASVAVDASGNVYIADAANHRVRMVNTSGVISTFAGNGTAGYVADGVAASSTELNNPYGVAVDGSGNVYIADQHNHRIRKVNTSGIISTVAGNGTAGYVSDGVAATATELNNPSGVAVDGSGDIFIADYNNSRIREVNSSGIINTVAGNGTAGYTSDGIAATASELNVASGVAVDGIGNIFIADENNHRVRMVNTSGIISTIAGTGSSGYTSDGVAATASKLNFPTSVNADAKGYVYIADNANSRIRKVTLPSGGAVCYDGAITYYDVTPGGIWSSSNTAVGTIGASNGVLGGVSSGTALITYSIAGCTATGSFTVNANPVVTVAGGGTYCTGGTGLSLTASGAGSGGTYTWVPASGLSSTIIAAPTATPSVTTTYTVTGTNSSGCSATAAVTVTVTTMPTITASGGGAICYGTSATLTGGGGSTYVWSPGTGLSSEVGTSVSAHPGTTTTYTVSGTTSVGCTSTATVTVTVNSSPSPIGGTLINTFAGDASGGYGGDGVAATATGLSNPFDVAFDASGNLYIADRNDNRVRKVSTSGIISTVAGTGSGTYTSDGVAATASALNQPTGVAFDASGNLYIADWGNARVRMVNTSGIISTVAGTGSNGYNGDGIAATTSKLNQPFGVALDASGNLYIADHSNSRIRKVNTSGIISTVAGTGSAPYNGDGIAATTANIYYPFAVAVDGGGNIYLTDNGNNRIRMVNTSGIISTVAGNGTGAFSGDGAAATAASIYYPQGVSVDGYGNIYIADYYNNRVRMVNASGIISTIAGGGSSLGDGGPATAGSLNGPCGKIAVDASGNAYVADYTNNRIRKIYPNNSTAICSGATITLTDASPGGAWSSSDPAVGTIDASSGLLGAITAGSASITYSLSGCTALGSVVVNATPVAAVSGGGTLCSGGTGLNLTASGAGTGGTYAWAPASGLSSTTVAAPTATPTVTTVYTVTATGSSGCANTDTVTVAYIPRPVITGVSPMTANGGASITITGTGFNPTSSDDVVFFGAETANITAASATSLTATLPVGANYRNIIVNNFNCYLSGSSDQAFFPDYPGAAGLVHFVVEPALTAGTGPVNTQLADIDGDGLPDVLTANRSSNTFTVFRNESSIGNINFASGASFGSSYISTAEYIAVGDLNGDGKPDVVVASLGTNNVQVFENTTSGATISFSYIGSYSTGSNPTEVAIGDIDGDGRADIVVANNTGANTISIIRNTTSGGTMSFATQQTESAGSQPNGVTLGDFDQDGKLDIAVSDNGSGQVGVLHNASTPGSFSFTLSQYTVSTQPTSIHVGDIDGDGKPDIIVTDRATSNISILHNNSTGTGSIAFAVTPETVGSGPEGIDVGDIDGDGKVDIAVSITGTGVVSVLRNESSSGSFSFASAATFSAGTGSNPQGVVVGDLDGDGMPDMAVSDYGTGKVTIFLNQPIQPITGNATVCASAGTTTLTEPTTGGVWSSSNLAVGSVGSASATTATVTGISVGTFTITYTVAPLYVVYQVTVNAMPPAISGLGTFCTGASATLTDATTGGTWTSSNVAVGTIGASSGVLGAVSAGSATITYSVPGCTTTGSFTVSAGPAAIGGTIALPLQTKSILTDATSGGAWASGAMGVASIGSGSGALIAVSAGTSVISYTQNGCVATTTVTVGPSIAMFWFSGTGGGDASNLGNWWSNNNSTGYQPTTFGTNNTTWIVQSNMTSTAALTFVGNLTVASGGTFTPLASSTTTVGGNWANTGGSFVHNSGTVVFSGANTTNSVDTLSGSMTGTNAFNNITFNGSGISYSFLGNSADVAGVFAHSAGTVTAPSTNLNVGGNFNHTGGTFSPNGGTVTMNGGASSITATGMTVANTNCFYNLHFNASGTSTYSISSELLLMGDFNNMTSSGTISVGNNNVTVNGNWNCTGPLTAGSTHIKMSGTGPHTMTGNM